MKAFVTYYRTPSASRWHSKFSAEDFATDARLKRLAAMQEHLRYPRKLLILMGLAGLAGIIHLFLVG